MPTKSWLGASLAIPMPSTPIAALAFLARVGPRSEPPFFLLPPTNVGAMVDARSRQFFAPRQPLEAMRSKSDSPTVWGATLLGLKAARERKIELVCSVAMLKELSNTLGKAKFAAKVAASEQSVDRLVDGYATLLSLVRPQPIARIAPDPDDDVVIATALAAKASHIVTGDKPLLKVKSYEGIEFITVNEVLITL